MERDRADQTQQCMMKPHCDLRSKDDEKALKTERDDRS
jgi:hypothetical protein